jgi:DNA-binding transcriptional LysR family regulator
MLDFELLRTFVTVAECGGFHRAAERLNLTQSTVSQQIKRLELETKCPLFRRTTRSVALTDDGEMLLGDARRLLQLEEGARHRLGAPRLSGTVRLGVVEEVAGGSLPTALGRFTALHRGVKLEVQIGVSAELIEKLNAGRLDVVFAKRPLGTAKGRLVWREPLVWAAADTFDLIPGAAVPLALYRERSVSREAALAALQDGELTWEIVYTSPSLTGCARRRLRAWPLRRFLRARSSQACAFSMPRKGCRVYPISSLLSTKRPGRIRPQWRSPQFCWRSPEVHRARRFEMAKNSNPPKVGYGSARDFG